MMSGGKRQKLDAEGLQFQQKWTEEFFFILHDAEAADVVLHSLHWLARIADARNSASVGVELFFSSFVSVDVNLDTGFVFDFYPGHTCESDPVPTFVSNSNPVSRFRL
ncbi:hypothetical protein EVAR_37197_1 [Eumeta japonica]|uniref:Uncharacterized protein n=1 Tax=Eumeta variegata TaxID=151549 RepID=A0A4C1YX71_EUMVA|nr:hypothetical protein EVAR_37197_1 [Eumeta japonica]